MAANRFASMLHRNTNKITLILIYAVLEWVLIVLLLLNSLFSYLIVKFAEFFGLKPPCLWCTRIDHVLDPANGGKNMHRDLLCEVHSKEISRLGFCSTHQKLVESLGMCEDCLSSRPELQGSSKNFSVFPWMKEFGIFQNDKEMVGENGEVSLNCSCCGVSLDNDKYSSYILVKTSSWDVLECAQKESFITEAGDYDDNVHNHVHEECDSHKSISVFGADLGGEEKVVKGKNETQMLGEISEVTEDGCVSATLNEEDMVLEVEREDGTLEEENSTLIMVDKSVQVCGEEDAPVETSPQHLEFFLDYSGHTLVPIELVDSMEEEHNVKEKNKVERDDESNDRDICLDFEAHVEEREPLVVESGSRVEKVHPFLDIDINEEPKYTMLDDMEIEEDENSLVFLAKDCHLSKELEAFRAFPLARWPSAEANYVQELVETQREQHSDIRTACEEVAQGNNENEADVSIGTEIPDLDIADEIHIEDSVHSYECIHEDPSTSSPNLYALDDHGSTQGDKHMVELQSLQVEDRENIKNHHLSYRMELNETEGDNVPDTPTSEDGLNQMHEKLLLLEKRDSRTEESLDDHGSTQVDEQMVELQSLHVEDTENTKKNQPSFRLELNEIEEDKVPVTPTSVDRLNLLHENLLLLGKRDSGTDESLDDHGPAQVDEQMVELQSLQVEDRENMKNQQTSFHLELNEIEEDKVPDTPTSVDRLNLLHENLLLLGKRDSGTDESLDDHGPAQVDEQMVELQSLQVLDRENMKNQQTSFHLEQNEIEEDKVPDTPTSVDSLNQLHKKLLLLEKRDSGTEESLDGSVTSDLEGSDGVVTVEHLKTALRAERKALQALYAELEEERSASAVAANQTMAMINRLQEEKAAMQMEALQYQRMMEEQSEYDQEALQLLNELMVKREKEKQELEKELEGYRKKLLDYETKERMRILRKSQDGSTRSGFSSASCSNAEDSDGLSLDLNQEAKEEEGLCSHQEFGNQNTPVDAVISLEESLAEFEEERLSILEQLKVLEEKLMTLDDDKEPHFEDVQAIDNFHEDNGNHLDENGHLNGEANGHENGFSIEMMNGKHHQPRRIAGQKGKSLLPLFDAICDENGDAMLNGNRHEFDSNGVHNSYESKFELEDKKLAIEEEVDHLYERLQALEADREFLKHCIKSLKKGDKGMDLLREILQHLRDLRSVELRVRNLGESAII